MDAKKMRDVINRKIFCGFCKHSILLLWESPQRTEQSSPIVLDRPFQLASEGEHWYAVQCERFKRRVEFPDRLRQCGAYQKRHQPDNGLAT